MRLPLILYPSRLLTEASDEVSLDFAKSVDFKVLVDSLRETLVWFRGIGISAVQGGWPARVFIMRLSRGGYQTFINPIIRGTDGDLEEVDEGCLSIPGIVERVKRYPGVLVSALDPETGERKSWDLEGIEAQCAQHEMEHLDGKTMADNWGPVKRDIVKRKIKKELRLNPLFKEAK
jgi:peptide deformylase